jgi:hypothetical protein
VKLSRPDLAAYGLVALCVLAIATLAVLGQPTPDVLQYLAVTALGIGGGVALQGAPTPAAVNLPAEAARAQLSDGKISGPAPAPLTSEPATGVFRAVTHAP